MAASEGRSLLSSFKGWCLLNFENDLNSKSEQDEADFALICNNCNTKRIVKSLVITRRRIHVHTLFVLFNTFVD